MPVSRAGPGSAPSQQHRRDHGRRTEGRPRPHPQASDPSPCWSPRPPSPSSSVTATCGSSAAPPTSRCVASKASGRGTLPQFPRPCVAHQLSEMRRGSVVGSQRTRFTSPTPAQRRSGPGTGGETRLPGLCSVWPSGQAVALGHGYDSATLVVGWRIVFVVQPGGVVQSRERSPRATWTCPNPTASQQRPWRPIPRQTRSLRRPMGRRP
jgi:hypothetical protein